MSAISTDTTKHDDSSTTSYSSRCKRCSKMIAILSNGLCSRCDEVLYGGKKVSDDYHCVNCGKELINPAFIFCDECREKYKIEEEARK